ncbi:hypothetical protein [Paraburkholderia aromaticivorans]|uniref:Uncharacterized protein n=1 Tax=Paraburkholderia aromaticivorans TaxID=2026199 RepID=A0A248VQD4_9BURK|nr:hypothetical protein [Paraburkholderia aromaticivorans]ASW00732.1 hypothetical protein CJU94_21000 [Paraburkholderia aromaticivorans]
MKALSSATCNVNGRNGFQRSVARLANARRRAAGALDDSPRPAWNANRRGRVPQVSCNPAVISMKGESEDDA